MRARFRLHFRGEKVAEARPPVHGGGVLFCLFAFLLTQLVNEFEREGGHVAADAGEGFRAVALAVGCPVGYGKGELWRVDLEIIALDVASDFPDLSFLDIDLLHATFRKDIVARVPDVLRHFVVEKSLTHFQNGIVF